LLALRRSEPALRNGTYAALDRDDAYVFAYLRRNPAKGDSILVALNMSAEPRTVKLDLSALGLKASSAKTLVAAPEIGNGSVSFAHFVIPPFGVLVGSVH